MTKKVKGKKGFQTVEGSEFLQRWRLRRAKIDEEMLPDGEPKKLPTVGEDKSTAPKSVCVTTQSAKKPDSWSRAAVTAETKLREQSLTSKSKHSNKLSLPFALKKSLVESWEVITQCHMVLSLPAPVTIRQALDKYLESKGVAPQLVTADVPIQPKASADPTHQDDKAEGSPVVDNNEERDHDWREMADGIALLFDEALPNRLLYREELPQYSVVCDHPEYSLKRFSEVYGCEHLLRLFVRLPEVIADEMSEAEARPILAKVNDFVRFLHKNQGTMFAQPYRKLNDLEMKERNKLIKKEESKRKRRSENGEDEVDRKSVV